ncbi:MAG: tRNA (N6-threonylcarbamoyladenosine(37)-N6)-methyltransferase TrmO [Prevotella sp.]|nr:tRNA (N6-threonylcarbamoyladenosine(37)-N6)-methyltransferase TrmO [Prevotella sp.]
MKVVAHFCSPLQSKFGTPRQSGVVPHLLGKIVFEQPFRSPDAVRGLEGFDYLWLIWGFSANRDTSTDNLTVRPPRLGGNKRVGVFATRSPYRPNALGLSSVKIHHIDFDATEAPVIYVEGADLMDGTPIYDVKPYIAYTDAHPDAKAGFTDSIQWQPLQVELTKEVEEKLAHPDYADISEQMPVCCQLLSQDPRPHYHDDPNRVYGMKYGGYDLSFKVTGSLLTVVDVKCT